MTKYKNNVGAYLTRHGVSFRVWAPNAQFVGLVGTFSDTELPMENENDGYWHLIIEHAQPGQEYRFAIHNNDTIYYRNDPRALHLTTSDGHSVIVDRAYDWNDDDFIIPTRNEMVIYEMHIGTFFRPDLAIGGTFVDAIEKLDHLASLGINMIELMPVNSMIYDKGWGYDARYIYAVETLYGGRHGLLKFVDEAHKRGMGVIMDVVYNHFNTWELDMWRFDGWGENDGGGIYFYNDWRGETPWGARPDYGRYEVRQFLLDNAKMWLEDFHIDGLRLDSTVYLRNTEGHNNDPTHDIPEAWKFIQEVNEYVKKRKPGAITVAEDVGGNDYITKPKQDGGAGFDTQWETGFPQALLSALGTSELGNIQLDGIEFELNRSYNGDPFQRVGYIDSHDSAANGSTRFNDDISGLNGEGLYARQRQLIAAGIVLTSPVVPMLLQGQEFQETGDFNDWRALDWEKAENFSGILDAHKHLISLRKNSTGVSAGLLGKSINISHMDHVNKVMVYHRWDQGGPGDDVLVIINFGPNKIDEYSFGFPRNGKWKIRFNSCWKGYSDDFDGIEVGDINVSGGSGSFTLPSSVILILSQDN